jgi:hypothetical protein
MARYTRAVLAAASLLALAAPSQAQHEHAQKLQGTWVRRAEGCKVKLEVKPEGLRCTMTTEEGMAITVDADYVVSKDGILLGILHTPVAPNAADADAVNRRLFYFQFTAEDRSLVVKDLQYKDSHDGDKMKEVLEGKYHRTEGAHKSQASHPSKGSRTKAQTSQAPADSGNTGCVINAYSSDPNRRISELLLDSENLRQIEYEWEQIWYTDEPSHMTPERVHGGIDQGSQTDWLRTWHFFSADALATAHSALGWWVGK